MKLKNKNKIIKIILILFATINISLSGIAFASVSANSLISLANISRTQAGLGDLTSNPQLINAAFAKANDMLSNDYFAHTSPSGKTPWDFIKAAGYSYTYAGENLAIGYTNAEELHNAWMNSPSHRENILNSNFREIGIAVVTGEYQGATTTVVVQMFGSTISQKVETDQISSTLSASASEVEGETRNEPVADNSHPQEFNIIKEKLGYTPQKLFVGEETSFKVVLTGEPKEITILVGDQKIDLIESNQSQQDSQEKIFQKNQKIEEEGNLPVTLIVSDKWGNRETLSLGYLNVSQKIITKNIASTDENIQNIRNFMMRNLTIMAILVITLTVGLAFYLGFRYQKFGKLV